MSPEEKRVICTGVEVWRDGDQFVFKPGEKPMWKLPVLNVAVDKDGNLLGGCKAMEQGPDGKCPHVRYEDAMYAIRQAAKQNGIPLNEGFVVADGEGREMTGLAFDVPTPPCHPGYGLRGGPSSVTNIMSRSADCPRKPAPEHEAGPSPSGVYRITDPTIRAEIDNLLGRTGKKE